MGNLLLRRQAANQTTVVINPGAATSISIAGQRGPGLSLVLPTSNAGSVVGAVTVTCLSGTYAGVITLSGPDAAKFALSNSGTYPCNLLVGGTALAAGNYNISLTATP